MDLDRELIGDCVHCGFCLPTCPTYLLWGEEMDSPRGRIHLMAQAVEGEPLTDSMTEHFDRCLGCMACVTACPSGVQYDKLIEATRAEVERAHPRSRRERLLREAVFVLFPYPRRLRLLRGPLRAYQRSRLDRLPLPSRLRSMSYLAPRLGPGVRLPRRIAARGSRRAVVGLLTGCVQSVFFPEVNAATARVLAAEGCDVLVPPQQSCCGALSLHNGREAEAQAFARRVIETFEQAGVDFVVVNAAGCGSAMKDYAHQLRDDPAWVRRAEALPVRDFTELLVELGPVAPRHPLPLRVAYHDACHLSHAQGIRTQPRDLLRGIPDLELAEIAEPEICCGSAGIYNLLQPDAATELGDRKAANALATGAQLLTTANPGCLMQIAAATARAGRPVPVRHIATVLNASLRGEPSAVVRGPGGSSHPTT
jgi:glycolate oxidase iron-sulfur subunit